MSQSLYCNITPFDKREKIVYELDQKIINELQENGFQKSSILSARLGVAERTVRRHVKAMISKGIIKLIAVPKPMSAAWRVWAKIGVKAELGYVFRVAHKLMEHPAVYFVACSLSRFDIIIAVCFDTADALNHFVNSELSVVEGILYTETMILTRPRKYYDFSWPEAVLEDNNGQQHYNAATTNSEVDDVDRQIIDILKEDALTPIRVLKAKLDIGESTIRKRMKRMLKEELFKIEAVPNPNLLGFEVWATIGLSIARYSADEVINTIIQKPAVYLASISLGRFNVIIGARFYSLRSLNDFFYTELPQINGVRSAEIFLYTGPLKYHHVVRWQGKSC